VALTLFAVAHDEQWQIYAWLGLLGLGLAFCFASLGTLVIDYSGPGETGVASGMNTIMRTVGAALGAQVAAAIITANTVAGTEIPVESGFTTAFAIAAAAATLAFLPTLLLGRRPVAQAVAEPVR
jgi:hypothetical protein